MKSVLAKVQKRIKPTVKEIESNSKVFNAIKSYIKSEFDVNAKLMGSVSKGTFMAGDKDLDIFIFFDPKTPRKQLEDKSLVIGRAVFKKFGGKHQIAYAEHPYVKGLIKGFDVEIVPAYKITTTAELISAVDRTPFHTKYVLNNLRPAKRDEVRLLKRFMKGIGVYGSDLKREGFSGYACELLILKYGSFKGVLEAAQSWIYQAVVDIELSHDRGSIDMLRRKFKEQPFILIDPTDPGRNVTAVLSKKQYARFIFFSREFMEKPKFEFFFPKKQKIAKKRLVKDAIDRGTTVISIDFVHPGVVEDILYPQLRRFKDAVRRELTDHGFNLLHSWVFGDEECGIGVEIETELIPKHQIVPGPSIFNPPEHQKKFMKKYKKVWFEDDRYVAEIERDYRNIHELMRKHILKGPVKKLKENGVPENIAKALTKKKRVLVGREIEKIKSLEFWERLEHERVK